MQSGIYLIGKGLNEFEPFEKHIEPHLTAQEISVPDRSIVTATYPNETTEKTLLVSLVGEDLERILANSILLGFNDLADPKEKDKWSCYPYKLIGTKYIGEHPNKKKEFFPFYQRISLYSNPEYASKEFPLRVQDYLLEKLQTISEEVEGNISELLGRKLSDFSS